MGTWKKATFNERQKAVYFKRGLKTGGISTTYNIPKKKGRYIVEYKE